MLLIANFNMHANDKSVQLIGYNYRYVFFIYIFLFMHQGVRQ